MHSIESHSQCFQQLGRWKGGSYSRPAVSMLKACSDREAGGSVPKLGWPEFAFGRVEDAGCRNTSMDNLSPDKCTAFADEGAETGRYRGRISGAPLMNCYLTHDRNGVP